MNTSKDVLNTIKHIVKKRFEMDVEQLPSDVLDQHLLGSKIGMRPRHLIYLFFDIEEEFGITIPQEDIVEGRFTTLNGIAGIVEKQLALRIDSEITENMSF